MVVNASVYNVINVLGDYSLRVNVLKKNLLDSLKLITKPVVGIAKIFALVKLNDGFMIEKLSILRPSQKMITT